jgi:hypothetical protein
MQRSRDAEERRCTNTRKVSILTRKGSTPTPYCDSMRSEPRSMNLVCLSFSTPTHPQLGTGIPARSINLRARDGFAPLAKRCITYF